MGVQNKVLGSGEVRFAEFKPGTENPLGELYFGSTTDLTMSTSFETVKDYDTDHGTNQVSDIAQISKEITGSFTCTDMSVKNWEKYLGGSLSRLIQAAAQDVTETFADVIVDAYYQLGASPSLPSGVRKVSNVVVKKGATALVAGTDYEVNSDLGQVHVLEGGSLVDGDEISVTYDVEAASREIIASGNKQIVGAFRFISFNQRGKQHDYYAPKVILTPDGDISLKGKEFMSMKFKMEFVKKADHEIAYRDGRPWNGL